MVGGSMQEESIGLQEAIRTLRAELTAAMAEGEGKDLQFRAGPIELEFLVQVERQKAGEAGIKFWVDSIGSSSTATSTNTHRIKLTLTPVTSAGDDLNVADRSSRPA